MIFVDTSVWFAALVPEDSEHSRARSQFLSVSANFVTTDYIVDELLTLLVARNQREVAVRVGDQFWSEKLCQLIWVMADDVKAA